MRKEKFYAAFCVISVFLFLSGCQTGQTKNAAPEVLAEFDFSIKDGAILLPVKFDGEEYKFALDTGAAITTFDDIIKDKLGKQIATHKEPLNINCERVLQKCGQLLCKCSRKLLQKSFYILFTLYLLPIPW